MLQYCYKFKKGSDITMAKKKWVWIPLILIIALVIGYSVQAMRYKQRLLPHTVIGTTDVSQLTQAEAISAIDTQLKQEQFRITDNGSDWKNLPKEELGVSFNSQDTVKQALTKQQPWLWGVAYFSKPKPLALTINKQDNATLDQTIATIKKELNTLNETKTPTKNAGIGKENGQFAITPEVQGDAIDEQAFLDAFKQAVTNGDDTIELENFIAKPTISAKDEGLKKELATINDVAQVRVSYLINGQDVTVPAETIASWVDFKDNQVTLNEQLVTDYVTQLGADYNTSTNSTSFNSTKRGKVEVPSGAYSWTIATNTEVAELTSLILAGQDINGRVPAFQGSANAGTPLIGNTYIEVDLQAQHMWYYKDGALALDTPVITGKPSTPTPPGMFYVWNKQRDQVLTGGEIPSPVDYWMPIDWTGVGIHDSDWQKPGDYGGDSYLRVGSHGCINTPPNICKELYNMIDVGVPVVIF